MIARDYLAAVRELPIASCAELTKSRPMVVLSPHPDDESLGAGGLIALARQAGRDVHVVILTDGSQSHPHSTSYPRERLIATRRMEVDNAGCLLGLSRDAVHHMGFGDTKLPTMGHDFQEAVQKIAFLITSMGAESLFVTSDADPHCDHEAAAMIARDVRRRISSLTLWFYPIWSWHLDPTSSIADLPPRGRRIDISLVKDLKRAAIAAHVSQMTDLIDDDPDGFRFCDDTLAPFLGRYEYFIEAT